MTSIDARVISESINKGMSQVAHALRRSAALREAISISPPEASVEEMLRTADRLAGWIRGSAEETDHERPRWQPPE